MSRLRLISLATLVAAALSLVACGGDTAKNNDYVDQVNEVTTTLQSAIQEIGQGGTVNSPEQASAVFDDFAAKINTAATDLEGITPPDEVADQHKKIVADLKALATEATGAANDIKSGGAAAVPGVAAGFIAQAQKLGGEIDSTIDEINSKLQG